MFKSGLFFYSFQKYVAFCILIALIRGYWEPNLTDLGFTLFKAWLLLCAVISGSGYIYLFIRKIRSPKLNNSQYLIIGAFVVSTALLFEYFRA